MAYLPEVLLTSDSNNTLWTNCIWDPHTGTNLMTYRGGGTAESKTLTFIGNDYLATVEKAKPVLHVWPINSYQTVQGIRFILPGKATAFAVSQDGAFLVAGIDEKIYLWQMSSGSLLTVINRHYQKVILLKFTLDGKFIVSAAEDGMVMVWALTTVAAHPEVDLVHQTSAGQHDPEYIFSDHSLPVTDLCVSRTGIRGFLCTVSSDRTCKIYDLTCGEMLLNLVFDVPLSAITMDILEVNIFIGNVEGNIQQFSLTNPPRYRDLPVNFEGENSFVSHKKAVTSLSVSVDGVTMASGSNDEQVILWHIPSKQPLRIIRHKGPITNAFFTKNIPAIYKQEFSPKIILHSLERALEKDSGNVTEMEIHNKETKNFWPKMCEISEEISAPTKEDETCKHEVETLKLEINKLKSINAHMFTLAFEKLLDPHSIKSAMKEN